MPKSDSWFTPETAKEMSLKAHAAKNARIEALRQAVETATNSPAHEYQDKRLVRVRLQLDRLDAMLMKETDPQKIDRLASAVSRLAEQERQLSNRPLPGTLRPSQPGKRTKQSAPEPIQPNEIPPP